MGGKSSSKSSTTNQNFNYDERIGASDQAVVYSNNIDGNGNTVTDLGAIQKSYDTLLGFSDGMFDFANSTRSETYDALNQNTKLAFEWANNASQTADERMINKALPILIIGGVIMFLAVVLKGRK